MTEIVLKQCLAFFLLSQKLFKRYKKNVLYKSFTIKLPLFIHVNDIFLEHLLKQLFLKIFKNNCF